jgi:hypothetical protein
LASHTSFDAKSRLFTTSQQFTGSNAKLGERRRPYRDKDSQAQQRFTAGDQLLSLSESVQGSLRSRASPKARRR